MQQPDTIKVDPDDRPPGRRGSDGGAGKGRRAVGLGLVLSLVLAAGAWWLWPGPPPVPAPAPPPELLPEPPVAAAPGPAFPLAAAPPVATAAPLPPLDDSDVPLGSALAELVGAPAVRELFLTDGLVRRFVVTVDNLPRRQASRAKWPVRAAPGAFVAGGGEAAPVLDEANFARYDAWVAVATQLDAVAAVAVYRRFYPLFQQAYEELGYPDGYFNDRLVEVIDDLLAAPEPDGPVRLVRPEVLYEFADPALESRSAGQKLLLRLGAANAQRIKAKLRELRALVAGG